MTVDVCPDQDTNRPADGGTSRRARLPGMGRVGAGIVVAMGGLAAIGPALSPYRPTEPAGPPLQTPSWTHPLGTNAVGQDLASQLMTGARVSLIVALVAGVGALLLGAAVGIAAGWVGGGVDAALMRTVDLLLALPRLPLLIVVGAYTGSTTLSIAVLIALISWPPGARVVRSQVLSLRDRAHLRAAVGFGARSRHVMRRHVLPEVGLILAADLVAAAGRAVMLEAGLAFLGLGDPTQSSWGAILRDALEWSGLFYTPAWSWWLLPPVAAITVLLLAITSLGVALESVTSPRAIRHRRGGR